MESTHNAPPPDQQPAPAPAADKRKRRYQPRPAAPPSLSMRCVTYCIVLATIAVALACVGLPWLARPVVLLGTIPLYVLCAVQLRRIFKLSASLLKGTDESRREAGILSSAKVRDPRCYVLVMIARPMFMHCGEGVVTTFFIGSLSSFGVAPDSFLRLIVGALMFAFSSVAVAYAMIPMLLMIAHLFDFIEAQPDVAKTGTGHPMPGTPASRRWVLGLRRITGLILYGAIALLVLSGACSMLGQCLALKTSGSTAALALLNIIMRLANFDLYASGIFLLAVIPLTMLQFVLVATCFCRFSLRSIFLLQFACAALVSLACTLPDGWNAFPVLVLLCVLAYMFFFVVNQDPEATLQYTPDFIRQRLIQRRAILRERARTQALADAQLTGETTRPS